jgi:ribosome-associated protein
VSDEEQDDPRLRSRGDARRKRKSDEEQLAALATALVGLSRKQRAKLALAETLQDAVEEATRFPSHSARARQLRIVRRELRSGDHVAVAAAVDQLLNPDGRPSELSEQTQAWVERFVAEGSAAVEAFLAAHAGADRQRLRGLARNASKAAARAANVESTETERAKAVKARKAVAAVIQPLLAQQATAAPTPTEP